MSYCRFLEGDVYAYECEGGVQFWVAGGANSLDRLCRTFNEAYQYALALRDEHGLDVPSYAIEALKADAIEEAERIGSRMSESRTIIIPSLALNYVDNALESVGVGGEMYKRETPLIAENAALRAEIAKLRELAVDMYSFARTLGYDHPLLRELGVEVDDG